MCCQVELVLCGSSGYLSRPSCLCLLAQVLKVCEAVIGFLKVSKERWEDVLKISKYLTILFFIQINQYFYGNDNKIEKFT